jgi:hypothetical protein
MERMFTKLLFVVMALGLSSYAIAQCADYVYHNQNGKWSSSDYFKVLEIKGSDLTDTSLPMTGATDGKTENGNYGTTTSKNPFGKGQFQTPLYTFDEKTSTFVKSDKTYPVKYYNCAFAPEHYSSAYTKLEFYGEEPSGKANACTKNDNSTYVSSTYNMKGFIEMNRLGKYEGGLGYIQIDGLHHIERIQWGYSSTSWKRGIKCDIKKEGENWKPLRWLPSDIGGGNFTTFSEQGYEFEEMFDAENAQKFSIRWRPWDGDTISFKPTSYYDETGETKPANWLWKAIDTTATWQVPRIHLIRIYAGIDGLEFATGKSDLAMNNEISIQKINGEIVLSKEARIDVYNLSGSLILSGKGKKINIEGIRKGQYIIRAIANDGSRKNLKMAL